MISNNERSRINSLENSLIKQVDIVFTVSQRLLKLAKKRNNKSFFLASGADIKLFETTSESHEPEDIINIEKPIVGYIGTITERLNIELLLFVAEKLKHYSFVFIGDIQYARVDVSKLVSQKNFYFLKGKKFQILPLYLKMFDVCIIPYHPEKTQVEPTKVYDYLASGKPIVSTPVAEILKFKDYIKIAQTKEEFANKIEMALSTNDTKKAQSRIKFAAQNSWDQRVEQIIEKIRNLVIKKAQEN